MSRIRSDADLTGAAAGRRGACNGMWVACLDRKCTNGVSTIDRTAGHNGQAGPVCPVAMMRDPVVREAVRFDTATKRGEPEKPCNLDESSGAPINLCRLAQDSH